MKVSIIYYSATGNTEIMAQHIESTLQEEGHDVLLLPLEEASEADAQACDLLVLGSPAMGVEEIEEYEFRPFFESIASTLQDKDVILFGSYDWGDGEWLETWQEECESFGAHVLATYKAMLDPQAEDLDLISESLASLF